MAASPVAGAERGSGSRRFRQVHLLPADPQTTFASTLSVLLPGLERRGYAVVADRPGEELVLEPDHRSRWRAAAAWAFPPLGLVALGFEDRVRVTLAPEGDGGTRMLVRGRAPLAVRRAFAAISGPA